MDWIGHICFVLFSHVDTARAKLGPGIPGMSTKKVPAPDRRKSAQRAGSRYITWVDLLMYTIYCIYICDILFCIYSVITYVILYVYIIYSLLYLVMSIIYHINIPHWYPLIYYNERSPYYIHTIYIYIISWIYP